MAKSNGSRVSYADVIAKRGEIMNVDESVRSVSIDAPQNVGESHFEALTNLGYTLSEPSPVKEKRTNRVGKEYEYEGLKFGIECTGAVTRLDLRDLDVSELKAVFRHIKDSRLMLTYRTIVLHPALLKKQFEDKPELHGDSSAYLTNTFMAKGLKNIGIEGFDPSFFVGKAPGTASGGARSNLNKTETLDEVFG